jgi:hypothetical protein
MKERPSPRGGSLRAISYQEKSKNGRKKEEGPGERPGERHGERHGESREDRKGEKALKVKYQKIVKKRAKMKGFLKNQPFYGVREPKGSPRGGGDHPKWG